MDEFARFQRLAAWSGIVLTVATALNVVTLLASVGYDANTLLSDPTLLLLIGSTGANWFHWSMAFDLIGYLSFAPVVLLTYNWFRARSPSFALLYSICGGLYSLIGSIGAVLLGVVVSTLARDYPGATAGRQEAMRVVIKVFYGVIVRGLWNPLEVLLVGIWFLGMGSFLRRERPALGVLSLIIGGFAMIDALGWIIQVELLFRVGVFGFSLLIAWAAWWGTSVLRRPIEI